MRGLTSVGCFSVESYSDSHSATMSFVLSVFPCNFLLIYCVSGVKAVTHNSILFTSHSLKCVRLHVLASASFSLILGIYDLFLGVCGIDKASSE